MPQDAIKLIQREDTWDGMSYDRCRAHLRRSHVRIEADLRISTQVLPDLAARLGREHVGSQEDLVDSVAASSSSECSSVPG